MTPDELRKLIGQEENPKLDFKIEYSLTRPEEWNELIKDILALANGNVGFADKAAHLIVGAGDILRPDHTRELKDANELGINRHDLLAKVNAVCNPRLPNLYCELVELDGSKILTVIIPPSPHLHELKIPLQTPKRRFQEQTVFIRCGDEILPASHEERLALEAEKKRIAVTDRPAVPLSENRSLEFITDPDVLLAKLYTEENDDNPLAGHNIPYQQRDPKRDIRRELRSALNATRYLLITAPTGVGKTREAATLAQTLMHEGYRVVRVEKGTLEVPREFPAELCDNPRRILIFLDDLNFLFRSAEPIVAPMTSDTAAFKQESYHGALLALFNTFEKWCGESEIRVIAIARDEPEMWQALNFSPRDPLWKRFTHYELPAPSNRAIVELLEESVARANLQAEEEDYPAIAKRNDQKFSTIVENLRDAQRENKVVTLSNFASTLDNVWRDQYERILHKQPAVRYIYDAIDLLRQIGVDLYLWIVEPTAGVLWDGDKSNQSHRRQIKRTLRYLVGDDKILAATEGKLAPRDGQIEAKGTRVDWKQYVPPVQDLFFRLATENFDQMLDVIRSLGDALENSGQFRQSMMLWQRGLELAPDNVVFLNGLGASLTGLKEYAEAEKILRRAAESHPKDALAQSNLGWLMSKQERYTEAEDAYRRAIEREPDMSGAYIHLGWLLITLGRFREANEIGEKLWEGWNGDHDVEIFFGHALVMIGDYGEAEQMFRWAVGDRPDDPDGHYYLGMVLAKQKQYADAEKSFRRALELARDKTHIYIGFGNALFDQGRFSEAEDAFRHVIQANPDDWGVRGNLGAALARQERYDEAIEIFNQVLAHNPNNAGMQFNLGFALVERERYTEAEIAMRRAIEIAPNYADAFNGLGHALTKLGRLQEAEDAFRRAIELRPTEADFYREYGSLLKDLGRHAEAESAYRQAIERASDDVRAHLLLGILLKEQERYSDATTTLAPMLQHIPDDTETHLLGIALLTLGSCLEKLERYDNAEDAYRRSIAVDPKGSLAYHSLATMFQHLGQFVEAIDLVGQGIEHDTDKESVHVHREYLRTLIGMREKWDSLLRELKWTSGNTLAYRILWESFQRRLETDSAIVSEVLWKNATGLLTDVLLRSPDALQFLEKHTKDVPKEFYSRLVIASIYKKLDDIEKSETYAEEARPLIPADDWYDLARLESICGNVGKALEHLLRASEQPDFNPVFARAELDFEWIRDDPRFDEIVVVPPEG